MGVTFLGKDASSAGTVVTICALTVVSSTDNCFASGTNHQSRSSSLPLASAWCVLLVQNLREIHTLSVERASLGVFARPSIHATRSHVRSRT